MCSGSEAYQGEDVLGILYYDAGLRHLVGGFGFFFQNRVSYPKETMAFKTDRYNSKIKVEIGTFKGKSII